MVSQWRETFLVLQAIVEGRRSVNREFVRVCDPRGQVVFSCKQIMIDGIICEFIVHLNEASNEATRRRVTVAKGMPIDLLAERLGIIPVDKPYGDFIYDVQTNEKFIHFRTMAGNTITFVTNKSDSPGVPTIATHSGIGTTFQLSHRLEMVSAEYAIKEFISVATAKECETFLTLLLKEPIFKFDSVPKPEYSMEFGDEKTQWRKLNLIDFRDSKARHGNAEQFKSVWGKVIESYADPDGKFGKKLWALKSLNRIIGIDERFCANDTAWSAVFQPAKQKYISQGREFARILNKGSVEDLYEELYFLQQALWLVQAKTIAERKDRLEASFNDKRLNNYGIQRGIVNRLRYELSLHGDFAEKTLELRIAVYKRDKNTCQYCGKKLEEIVRTNRNLAQEVETYEVFHIDHVLPLAARGGTNDLANLQLLCSKCNMCKGTQLESEMDDDVIRKFHKNRTKKEQ